MNLKWLVMSFFIASCKYNKWKWYICQLWYRNLNLRRNVYNMLFALVWLPHLIGETYKVTAVCVCVFVRACARAVACVYVISGESWLIDCVLHCFYTDSMEVCNSRILAQAASLHLKLCFVQGKDVTKSTFLMWQGSYVSWKNESPKGKNVKDERFEGKSLRK